MKHSDRERVEEAAESEANWVSVEERLPEVSGHYLTYTPTRPNSLSRSVHIFFYGKSDFETHGEAVSHWMPLPKPPKSCGE